MNEEYFGKPFRQIAHKLRIHRAGQPDKIGERPRKGSRDQGWGDYLDSDQEPTLITFDEFDRVDIGALLRSGAIVAWEPPKEEVIEDGKSLKHRDADIPGSIQP